MDSLFSIVVLTYNQANLIEDTLDSIYKQSYSNIELIISDDASSDEDVYKRQVLYQSHQSLMIKPTYFND